MKRLDNSHLPCILWSHVNESTETFLHSQFSKYFKSFDLKNMHLKLDSKQTFEVISTFSQGEDEIVKWLALHSKWEEFPLASWIPVFRFDEYCILILATYKCTWYKIGDLKNGSKFL